MNPFGPPPRVKLPPELADEAAILTHLGMSPVELKKIWWYRAKMYNTFELVGTGGKTRVINAPNDRLKYLQRQLVELLEPLYRVRNPVHGFVAERSVKTNALSHLRRSFILNIDLQDFFPSISENRIVGLLRSLGIDARVADIIGRLCCLDACLPQGAPTSPVISNMICFRLDKQLMNLAKTARCIYTRYADDLTFSSYQPMTSLFEGAVPLPGRVSPEQLAPALTTILSANGFTLNPKKSHYADRHSRRMVTGLKVNELLNVDRHYVRNVRAALHSVEKLGLTDAQAKFVGLGGKGDLTDHLRGKISWLRHIKGAADPVVRGIAHRFNLCFPLQPIAVTPTAAEQRDRAVWIVEHDDAQGTCFFLKGVGLVTAAHCVQGVKDVEVFHPSKHANTFPATVLKRDDGRDLAILSHTIPDTEFYELDRAGHAVAIGDPMTAAGYPAWAPGDPLNIRPGVISTVTVKGGRQLIEVTQKLTQGMSGGPLLDANAAVAGIIHKGGPEEGRDFAIDISMLVAWLAAP